MPCKETAILVHSMMYNTHFDNTWIYIDAEDEYKNVCIKGDLTDRYQPGAILVTRKTRNRVPACGRTLYYLEIVPS